MLVLVDKGAQCPGDETVPSVEKGYGICRESSVGNRARKRRSVGRAGAYLLYIKGSVLLMTASD